MKYIASILLTAMTVLITLSGNAFAGVVAVPEPGTLTLIAVGVGALAGVKYLTRKRNGADPPAS